MNKPLMADDLRAKIIANPAVLLDDSDVMRALVDADAANAGGNVIDLRSVAMDRLAARLDRLEDTHRTVIAAAYDNVAGTHQIHRAALRLLEATSFDQFLSDMVGDIAHILGVDTIKLVLESDDPDQYGTDPTDPMAVMPAGFVAGYLTMGRKVPIRPVTLRATQKVAGVLHGNNAETLQSEACLKIELGQDRLPALLILGSEDAQMFTPQQGTDLLAFLADVFGYSLRRWIV